MRGGILTICFLVALPFLAAVGHDLYLAYGEQDTLTIEEPPKLTDVTWMLVTYSPDTYDWIQNNISEEMRTMVVVPVLQTKTVILGAVPLAGLFLFLLIARIFGTWPFSERSLFRGGKDKSDYSFKSTDKKQKQVKYKRK